MVLKDYNSFPLLKTNNSFIVQISFINLGKFPISVKFSPARVWVAMIPINLGVKGRDQSIVMDQPLISIQRFQEHLLSAGILLGFWHCTWHFRKSDNFYGGTVLLRKTHPFSNWICTCPRFLPVSPDLTVFRRHNSTAPLCPSTQSNFTFSSCTTRMHVGRVAQSI